jgi:hypothetical protein
VIQQKTGRPVQFELTEPTRVAVSGWIRSAHLRPEDFLFPSRVHASPHLGTRQYARIVDGWTGDQVDSTWSSEVASTNSIFIFSIL